MIFDCDYYNTPIASGYQDTEGSLTSPVLNFEAIGSVIVNWESYFRYCCYPFAPVFLEVGYTVDGVTSWTAFDGHGGFIESANTASANPLPVGVDVSCVAAYQDSVQTVLRTASRGSRQRLQPLLLGRGRRHDFLQRGGERPGGGSGGERRRVQRV